MKPISFCALALLAGGMVGPFSLAKDKNDPISDKLRSRLGADLIERLQKADRVEAFLIGSTPAKGKKTIGGYPIKETNEKLDKDFVKNLRAVLLQDKTYFGRQARCFLPGVAFRMHSGKQTVDVVICFRCENLRLTSQGNVSSGGGFGPDLKPLLKLALAAFPKNADLQKLMKGKTE